MEHKPTMKFDRNDNFHFVSVKCRPQACNFRCFACVNRYTKLIHAEIFEATLTAVTFKENQVYRQETIREEIDNDPSEGQDWNWEDYE